MVGTSLVRHLIGAGREVRALSRSEAADAKLIGLGAATVRGHVLDTGTLRPAMAGCEVVYHVAGVNQMCVRDTSEMFRVNIEGSRNVVRAASTAGVRRVVYTSSAATIGEADGEVGDELAAHRGFYYSQYERSKHEAELAVMSQAGDVEVVSVNPSSVQGPGRAGGTGKLILDLLRGRLPALVDTAISIVDIDDCARGHLQAAQIGRPGERYILNSFTLEMREAVATLERVVGRPIDARFLPAWMARLGGGAVEFGARLAGRQPPFCREMVATMLHGHRYDGGKAERELGLTYSGPDELMSRLVEWFRTEGLLDG